MVEQPQRRHSERSVGSQEQHEVRKESQKGIVILSRSGSETASSTSLAKSKHGHERTRPNVGLVTVLIPLAIRSFPRLNEKTVQ